MMDWPAKDDPFQPRRSRREIRRELDDEFEFHLEMRSSELIAQGFSEEDAQAEAERRFGSVNQTRNACIGSEASRDRRRHWIWALEDLTVDVKHALRQFRRRPGFAAVAITTLAIGIGASTAIVSVADQILLRPLPYSNSDKVVALWQQNKQTGEMNKFAPGNFVSLEKRANSFSSFGLAEPFGVDLIGEDSHPIAVPSWKVSSGFFEALGITPLIGRTFNPEEYLAEGSPSAMISHSLWIERFGGDPTIVGRQIDVDYVPTTVVGVLPREVAYPQRKDIWSPLVFDGRRIQDRKSDYMFAVARLAPGVSALKAGADLDRLAAQLAEEFPDTNSHVGFGLVPIREQIFGEVQHGILVLLGAVVVLLLIACANVASLLLARGAERSREASVRAAIGAGRGRLVRQFITESVVLALLGSLGGIAVAWGGIVALRSIAPPDLPRIDSLHLDSSVLPLALFLSFATALIFGVLPALKVSRSASGAWLRSSTRTQGAERGHARLRSALVVAEIALALVLLTGAGLLGRSFHRLRSNTLGFSPGNTITLQMFLWDRNPTADELRNKLDAYQDQFQSLPGVESVGIVSSLPFHPHAIDADGPFHLNGWAPDQTGRTYTTIASPSYFSAMSIPLKNGRTFSRSDSIEAPQVAIVNESFVRQFVPTGDPIGREIEVGVMSRPAKRMIVGVVGDVRPTALDSPPRPEIFIPFGQTASGHTTYVIKTSVEATSMVSSIREAVWEIDPQQTIYHLSTFDTLIRETLRERQFHLVILSTFAGAALLLAFVGIYGLVSFTTQQRSSEIGVRMAVGAGGRQIMKMIIADAMRLGAMGSILGVAGAIALTRFLSSMLYEVTATDPLTYILIVTAMLGVATLSSVVPAWRMARLDPARTLREE